MSLSWWKFQIKKRGKWEDINVPLWRLLYHLFKALMHWCSVWSEGLAYRTSYWGWKRSCKERGIAEWLKQKLKDWKAYWNAELKHAQSWAIQLLFQRLSHFRDLIYYYGMSIYLGDIVLWIWIHWISYFTSSVNGFCLCSYYTAHPNTFQVLKRFSVDNH